MQITSN